MGPSSPVLDALNCASTDAIVGGDDGVGSCVGPYFRNVLIGQFSRSSCFTFWANRLATIFSEHVAHIVSMRPNEKVRRVNTRRGIARVADMKTFGDLSVAGVPRQSVCEPCFPADPEDSVALLVFRGSPQPTTFGFMNFRPKIITVKIKQLVTPDGGNLPTPILTGMTA